MSPRHRPVGFSPPALLELEADRTRFKSAEFAPLTLASYARDWRVFSTWCAAAGLTALPASSDTVELYCTDLLRRGRKVSTLKRHIIGIQHMHRAGGHESPCGAAVRMLLAGAQRLLCQQPAQKEALAPAEFARIALVVGTRTAIAARDTAIVLFGFASALRRSSLRRLTLEDLTFGPRGILVRVLREKQDRRGIGRIVAVARGRVALTCPVRATERWLEFRGREPGPLFCHVPRGRPLVDKPLLGNRIGQIVQEAVARIGLDPARYGAHSLRASYVTEALSRGANEIAVARHTGHRSLETVSRYMRQRNPWRGIVGGKAIGL